MQVLKPLIAFAIFAAPMTFQAGTAEAGLGRQLLRMHLARKMHRFHHHQRSQRRYVYIAPVVRAPHGAHASPTRTAQRSHKPVATAAVAAAAADQNGRTYDPAGMAWYDGANQCWTGTQTWSFKNGSWYYGGSRWYRSGDTWRSDMSDPPAPVACHTVPAFATVQPAQPTTQGVPRREGFESSVAQNVEREPERQTERIAPASTKSLRAPAALCKKYFASIGELVAVPCDG